MSSSKNFLLSKSTSKCFLWKCCIFSAKMVHQRPLPSSCGCSQNNSLYRNPHCLLLHSDNVECFFQSEGLIFKKSYSSSLNQSNKAYLEDEVLSCYLLPLALWNQVRKETAILILLPLAHSLNSHEVGVSVKGRASCYCWFQALAGKNPFILPLANGHSLIWRS